MKKKDKPVTLFYNELVSVYFQFFEKKFGIRPSFDGSSPRDLKTIIDSMKNRSEEKNVEWTLDLAKKMLETFLQFCYLDVWLKENFLLPNLNRQKDKIFIKIKNQIDGKSNSETPANKHIGSYKTAGQEVFAERLRERIKKL